MSTSKIKKHLRRMKHDERYRRQHEQFMRKHGKRTRQEELCDMWELNEKLRINNENVKKISDCNENVDQGKQDYLAKRSRELNYDTPKSELWFYKELKRFYLDKLPFTKNFPLNNFIFDLKYRDILIEIDGSFHDRPDQKIKDKIKTDYIKNETNFILIRVKAYDIESLNNCIQIILDYKQKNDNIKY